MSEKETLLRNNIDIRRQQIADGVSAETKERMEREILGYEEELRGILAEERLVAEQEQMVAEVDAIVLKFDFDTDFGTVGLNETMRQILMQELAGGFEREIQLKRQNGELQIKLSNNAELIEQLQADVFYAEGNREIFEDTIKSAQRTIYDIEQRTAEVEQNRLNCVKQLEEANAEIERLEQHVDDLRTQIAVGEKQAQHIIDVTPTINDLYEQAKQATAEKRKVIVTAELGLYREVQGADGSKEMVHHTALAGMEQVYSFPELPELPAGPFAEIQETDISSGLGDIAAGTDQGVPEVTRIEFDQLKSRVDTLFAIRDREVA